ERTRWEQMVIDDASAVVAECPQDEADLMRFYEVPRSRIVTVPCGGDTDVFRPMGRALARARRGWDNDKWIVLRGGRMVPRYGVGRGIDAGAGLHRRGRADAYVVVVGGACQDPDEEPYVRGLMHRAGELGISENVRFAGRVDHHLLPQYYGAAD